jgi:hypothetical protein
MAIPRPNLNLLICPARLRNTAKSDITPKQGKQHSTPTRKNNFVKQSYQNGEIFCWIHRSWKLCWSTWKSSRLWVSLSEKNNNFTPFSNWAWNYKISCKNSRSCTMFIPSCLARPIKSAAKTMTGRKKMKEKYYPKLSPHQLDPPSRNVRAPTPTTSACIDG